MRVLCTALGLYLVAMTVVLVVKPDTVYNHKTRQYRTFGTTEGATLTPLWLVSILAAVGAYTVASIALSYPSVVALLPFMGQASVRQDVPTGSANAPSVSMSPPLSDTSAHHANTAAPSALPKPASSDTYKSVLPAAPPLYEFRQPKPAIPTEDTESPLESMYDHLRRPHREATYADTYYNDDPVYDTYYEDASPQWPSPGVAMYYPPAPVSMPMRAYGGGRRDVRSIPKHGYKPRVTERGSGWPQGKRRPNARR